MVVVVLRVNTVRCIAGTHLMVVVVVVVVLRVNTVRCIVGSHLCSHLPIRVCSLKTST